VEKGRDEANKKIVFRVAHNQKIENVTAIYFNPPLNFSA